MSTYSNSYSQTNTYTEARARYIMDKIYEDTLNMWNAGLITKGQCDNWRTDLLYLLNEQILIKFEFQFRKPNGDEIGGLRQIVKSDGSISTDDDSGGNDFFNLPSNAKASLVTTLDRSAKNYADVKKELANRGWGFNGKSLTGSTSNHGSYSKDGYGVNIKKIGEW